MKIKKLETVNGTFVWINTLTICSVAENHNHQNKDFSHHDSYNDPPNSFNIWTMGGGFYTTWENPLAD